MNIAAADQSVALVALVALYHHVKQMGYASSGAEEKIHILGVKVNVFYLVFFAMSVTPNCILHTQRDLLVLWVKIVSQNAGDEISV